MKILSPVGNFECLKLAVYNGADEVYLGINEFNARNNIDGFSIDNLEEAVDFAHIFNVKVCLAVNILFNDEEIVEAFNLVIKAYSIGVDAFIIQDLGLIKLLYENYPQIEIHASTQMGIHNLEGVLEIAKYGIKRVVLARETPLDEIIRIKKHSDVELEYFVQGALCVSFSGNCYLSSYLNNASGNRGRCKQLCRLPYTLFNKETKIKKGYLLSAKDFNLSKKLVQLKNAGIDVIKIEGRARRAFYVGAVTREYYNALHGISACQDIIGLAFNRLYTEGYFNGNDKIISQFNNHVGIEVGKVINVKKGRNFNEVYISSNRDLSKKSTFKIFYNNIEKNVLTAYDLKSSKKGEYVLTTTQNVEVGGSVRLIIDENLERQVLTSSNKQKIKIDIFAKEGEPLTAQFLVTDKTVSVKGELLIPSKNSPLTKTQILESFLKSEYFLPEINVKILDQVFVPKSKLNEFRRKVYDIAFEEIVSTYKKQIDLVRIKKMALPKKFTDFQVIENLTQDLTSKNVILSPETYDLKTVKNFIKICNSVGATPYLDTPNFALAKDVKLLEEIIESTQISIIANNYYALQFKTDIIIGAGLNVYNTYTALAHDKPFFTAESELGKRVNFPYMTLRHCPIKEHVGGDCGNCKYENGYYYLTEGGKRLNIKRKKLHDCTFYLTD